MRDRIVLIGATAPSLNDFFFTPDISGAFREEGSWFKNQRRMAGVVIHANLISQMVSGALEGRAFLQVWSEPLEWIWIFTWSAGGALLAWGLRASRLTQKQRRFGKTVAIVLLAGAGAIAIGYLAFLNSWWIPVVRPLVALFASAIIVSDYNSRKLLRDRDRRLTQFLEAVPVGITVVDTGGNAYFFNEKAKQILAPHLSRNASVSEIDLAYRSSFTQGDRDFGPSELLIQRALKGESTTADDIEIYNGDRDIPIEAWGTPIYDEEGNISFAIVAFQDISDRKKAEQERQAFIQKLSELNEDLERSLDAEIRLIEAAERFVPNQFLSFLGYESIAEVKLGDAVEKEMSVLFCDIRNFTTLSEAMSPEENFKFINAYLSRMEPAIIENNGFIDKYIGDAIMALFGGGADDAVQAGISMLKYLSDYNTTRGRPGRPKIKIGIGINTGSLMLGTVGGINRLDGTVISDAVNLASRIETLTKYYGVELLITQQTFLHLQNPGKYDIRLIDRVQVKGKSEQVTVYEIFDADPPELREGKLTTKSEFEKAILLFHLNSFSEAQGLFQRCLTANPGDKVSQIYLERCEQERSDRPLPTQP
jgi:class 3 adenylate cyclase/PAS domain-containing protein